MNDDQCMVMKKRTFHFPGIVPDHTGKISYENGHDAEATSIQDDNTTKIFILNRVDRQT